MKTAETNAVPFNPVIPPPGVDLFLSPAKVDDAAKNFASAIHPYTGSYTFCTRFSNVENHAQLSVVPSLASKNTEIQKPNSVHVSTFHQAACFSLAVATAPVPCDTMACQDKSVPRPSHRSRSSKVNTTVPSTPSLKIQDIIPLDVQNRRFRAHSFAATLSPDQRTQLFTWLLKFSLDDVLVKVAAPAPAGFGRKINRTTLQRLRNLVENTDLTNFIGDAMDSACDVLDAECAAHTAPMRETLSLLLYSRALNSARTASELDLNRLINAIAKVEKLKPANSAAVNPRFEEVAAAEEQSEAAPIQAQALPAPPAVSPTPTPANSESAPAVAPVEAQRPTSESAPAAKSLPLPSQPSATRLDIPARDHPRKQSSQPSRGANPASTAKFYSEPSNKTARHHCCPDARR